MGADQPVALTAKDALDRRLFVVIVCVLLMLAGVFGLLIHAQWEMYTTGADAAVVAPANHSAFLAYARGMDFAVAKTSSMFLGFAMVFAGVLYVLRAADVAYKFDIVTGSAKAALSTASPGLVVTTLGSAIVLVSVLSKSSLGYSPETETTGVHEQNLPAPVETDEELNDARPRPDPADTGGGEHSLLKEQPRRSNPPFDRNGQPPVGPDSSTADPLHKQKPSPPRQQDARKLSVRHGFQADSVALNSAGREQLVRLCNTLRETRGVTSGVLSGPYGDDEMQRVLAGARLNAIYAELVKCAPAIRFTVMSYGESPPASGMAEDDDVVVELQ